MTLPSMICAAPDGRSSVVSMCDSKKCRSLEFSILVGMPLGVDSYHGTGPSQLKVNIMFKRKKDKLAKDVSFRSHLADFVL